MRKISIKFFSRFLYFNHNVNLQMKVLDRYNVTFIVLHQSYKELTHELQFIESFSSEVSLFISSAFRQA